MKLSCSAFTLVELSIVLVIIGLITGGILAGQNLIRAGQVRDVGTRSQGFIAATQQFVTEFRNLPGDMPNAIAYWGAAHGTPADCITAPSTTATCNGNGNGLIDNAAGSMERYRFWQHLANAGLIEGSYDGVAGSGGANHATSTNSPSGKMQGSQWWIYHWGVFNSAGAPFFYGDYTNTMVVGKATTSSWPSTGLLTPEEAYGIDSKIDDGLPGMGKIVSAYFDNNCTPTTTADQGASATYKLTDKREACGLYFRNAFK